MSKKDRQLIKIFEEVRDIPFQFIGSRDVESMLKAGAGTCNAKHVYLKQKIDELGYPTRFVVDEFNLSDFLKGLDHKDNKVQELENLAAQLEPYYHTYLQINKDNKWISLDVTFDSKLAQFGFVTTTDWNGESDTNLPHTPLKTYYVEDKPEKLKGELLAEESQENKKLRQDFFSKLNDYISKNPG